MPPDESPLALVTGASSALRPRTRSMVTVGLTSVVVLLAGCSGQG